MDGLRRVLASGGLSLVATPKGVDMLGYIEAVLDIAEEADNDEVVWRGTGMNRRALAPCSDWFWLATADCEEIMPADVPLLRGCLTDLQDIERQHPEHRNDNVACAYLWELYASRKRGMRPMRQVYDDPYDGPGPLLADLFNAAGPER